MTTLQIAATLFGLAALGGVALAFLRARGSNPPLGIAALHGIAAAAGVVTLAYGVLRQGLGGAAMISLVLLVAAALGGLLLVSMHLRGKLLPMGLVAAHGGLAVAGFGALLVHLLA